MAKHNFIQTGFIAGELSPRMELRDDAKGRKFGCDFLENFFIHLQGPIETCFGFEFVNDSVLSSCYD